MKKILSWHRGLSKIKKIVVDSILIFLCICVIGEFTNFGKIDTGIATTSLTNRTEYSTSEKFIAEKATEIKPIVLKAFDSEIPINVGETWEWGSFKVEKSNIITDKDKIIVVSSNEKIAKAEITDVGNFEICVSISGLNPGTANISICTIDGDSISDKIKVIVSELTTEKITTTQETTSDEEESMVYITASGNCYHTEYCRYLRGGGTALTLRQAKSRGLRACKVCCA